MNVDNVMFPPLARRYFNSCFPKIKQALSLDFDDDATARDTIDTVLLRERPGIAARRHDWISDQEGRQKLPCMIVAPGPTLEINFARVFKNSEDDVNEQFVIAVDGAARLFLENDVKVDAVITDLDGLTTEHVMTLHDDARATIIIHGHGNNLDKIEAFFARASLDERYVFTTQIEPSRHVANLGGFTDGDRAIFAGIALGFKHLSLVAMDLDAAQIGHYSKPDYIYDEDRCDDEDLILARHPGKEHKIKIALATLKWLSKNKPSDCTITTLYKEPPFDFMPNRDDH